MTFRYLLLGSGKRLPHSGYHHTENLEAAAQYRRCKSAGQRTFKIGRRKEKVSLGHICTEPASRLLCEHIDSY